MAVTPFAAQTSSMVERMCSGNGFVNGVTNERVSTKNGQPAHPPYQPRI
jgi:hypothetical protein